MFRSSPAIIATICSIRYTPAHPIQRPARKATHPWAAGRKATNNDTNPGLRPRGGCAKTDVAQCWQAGFETLTMRALLVFLETASK
jgi:hypothetical protein